MSKPDTPITQQKIVEMATLVFAANPTVHELRAATGLSANQQRTAKQSETYKKAVEALTQELISTARSAAVGKLAQMIDPALTVVLNNLKKDNLEAAKIVFKALGVEETEKAQQDTQIQIVLPGQKLEKVIDSEGREV